MTLQKQIEEIINKELAISNHEFKTSGRIGWSVLAECLRDDILALFHHEVRGIIGELKKNVPKELKPNMKISYEDYYWEHGYNTALSDVLKELEKKV